jgi:DNA-binding YbaB/EbfC family protein
MFKNPMAGMMKKAQQMQDNMRQAQEEVKALTALGEAGNGAVKLKLTGEYKVQNIDISEIAMTDKSMLDDLILTAFNQASAQIMQASNEKMKNATNGINIPGMNLPF